MRILRTLAKVWALVVYRVELIARGKRDVCSLCIQKLDYEYVVNSISEGLLYRSINYSELLLLLFRTVAGKVKWNRDPFP